MAFLDRRSFLFAVVAAPLAFLGQRLFAAKKTVTTTPDAASKALVKPTDTMPAAMKYVEKADKAPTRTDKKATCANCMHYTQAVGADGKDIKVKGDAVGTCNLFDGGKGYVKSGGWCMSWFAAPA